jgi:hypothetical protein
MSAASAYILRAYWGAAGTVSRTFCTAVNTKNIGCTFPGPQESFFA